MLSGEVVERPGNRADRILQKAQALANADVDALITILPRITSPNLTKEECTRLELPDLIALAGKVIGFLSPKPAE